jgi:hypothetical protein
MSPIGPTHVAVARDLPPRRLQGTFYHSGDPLLSSLDLRPPGHPGRCHDRDGPLAYYATTSAASAHALITGDAYQDPEPITCLRLLVTVSVDLEVMDFTNPLALSAYGINPALLTGESAIPMRTLARVARERDDIQAFLGPCPDYIGATHAEASLLAIQPAFLKRGAVDVLDESLVRVDVVPRPVPEPSS